MNTLRDIVFWNNSLLNWAIGLGVALLSFTILAAVLRFLVGRVAAMARETGVVIDDLVIHVLGQTKRFTLFVVSLFVGSQVLELSAQVEEVMRVGIVVVALFQVGVWGTAVVGFLIKHHTAQRSDDGAAITSMKALSLVVRLALWSVVALLILDNFGVDITALVAGLGVGGIAVALAVQNVLGDLFASLSIVMDKPFVNGDFIVVGDLQGSVEHVGLKTTRVRSLSGEQLVFSNSDLLTSRIRNFGRMGERRATFKIGVTYDTPRDILEKIPGMIRQSIEAQSDTRFDRSHFASFGDSALMFETVYYMKVPNYGRYMNVQQAINLSIHEQFESHGIEFAYPTQTIHVTAVGSST